MLKSKRKKKVIVIVADSRRTEAASLKQLFVGKHLARICIITCDTVCVYIYLSLSKKQTETQNSQTRHTTWIDQVFRHLQEMAYEPELAVRTTIICLIKCLHFKKEEKRRVRYQGKGCSSNNKIWNSTSSSCFLILPIVFFYQDKTCNVVWWYPH